MPPTPHTRSVLIVDDGNSAATYDLWFREDVQRLTAEGQPPRHLQRYGDVHKTARAALAALSASINDQLLPDLILVDQFLSTGGPYPQLEAAGLNLMSSIRDLFEAANAKLPPCVLWTGAYSPGLAFAFCARGGRQALSRTLPVSEVIEALWAVLEGDARWTHQSTAPPLSLTDAQIALLPYLEADMPVHLAATSLNITAPQYTDRRKDIKKRINDLQEELGQPRLEGSGLTTSLAAYARDHGHIWIPLAYREGS